MEVCGRFIDERLGCIWLPPSNLSRRPYIDQLCDINNRCDRQNNDTARRREQFGPRMRQASLAIETLRLRTPRTKKLRFDLLTGQTQLVKGISVTRCEPFFSAQRAYNLLSTDAQRKIEYKRRPIQWTSLSKWGVHTLKIIVPIPNTTFRRRTASGKPLYSVYLCIGTCQCPFLLSFLLETFFREVFGEISRSFHFLLSRFVARFLLRVHS